MRGNLNPMGSLGLTWDGFWAGGIGEGRRRRARAKVDHWVGRKLWLEQVIRGTQLVRSVRGAAASTVGLLPSSSLESAGVRGVGKGNLGPGVRETWALWRGVSSEEVERGACLDGHILERKSLVAVGHGQSLCQAWYSTLRNLKCVPVPGQLRRWRISAGCNPFSGTFKVTK